MTLLSILFSTSVAVAEPAELILRHGEVWTGDPAHPRAQALAVRGGSIVAVGDDAQMAALVGPRTQVIELHGRAVVPALTDGHAHLAGLGLDMRLADLRGCATPDECAERAAKAPGAWALGRGWDQNRFPSRQFPTRAPLDRVLGARPAWLVRVDGHAGWANAEALRRAKITRATPDPPGGRILRDGAGEPTGVLVDAAMELVDAALPHPSAADVEAAILRAQDAVLAEGLTEVNEMGVDAQTIEIYRQLDRAKRLKLRVRAFASADQADTILQHPAPPRRPNAMFELVGIKLYADGALGSRGAALLAPYADDPKNRGLEVTPERELERIARLAVGKGWQVAVHAIGDRGNRNVIDAFERAGATPRDRFRIEHAQVVALDDIPRIARLGLIASMQPTHATSDMPWAEARIGKERLKGAYAWRRMLNAHVPLSFGSDFPVEEVSVVAGIKAAVERGGWTLDQKLSLDEALRAFTAGAAFSTFEEGWRGRAAPGQAADLTVLDGPLDRITGAHANVTIVGGAIVHQRSAM